MKPRSKSLFHFTRSLDALKGILVEGIKPKYCLEDVSWISGNNPDYVAYPMSSFCDIPLSRISDHTKFYGGYGIGLTKRWGLRNSLNPIIYCSPEGHIHDLTHDFAKAHSEIDDEDIKKKIKGYFFKVTSLAKPLTGTMVVNGTPVTKDFYQENEWRYIPDSGRFLVEDKFEEQRDEKNKEIENLSLRFSPEDVRYIFVSYDSEIPALVDYINQNMGGFSLNDLKILQSRIFSLENIFDDL